MQVLRFGVIFFAGMAVAGCITNAGDESASAASLAGAEWLVEDIDARGVIDYARTTMRFGPDGRLTGNTACNGYFADYEVDGTTIQIGNAGVTKRACAPAVMDQEQRFLTVFNAVNSYRIDSSGALTLSTPANTTITARQATGTPATTTYRCSDNSLVEAWYPTTDTARIIYKGRTIEMKSVVSASGARYTGGGWQWWTKGMTEGLLSPLATGESISSASGVTCTVP